jgi:hypothetical protein
VGSGLIRKEMAVADTTKMLDDVMIDPVTEHVCHDGARRAESVTDFPSLEAAQPLARCRDDLREFLV